MDISHLSASELRSLQQDITAQLKKREVEELAQAREKILEIASQAGVSLSDLVSGGFRKKVKATSKLPAQFRHPEEKSQHWSGRGRQPNWVKEWLSSGRSLDELRA